MGIIAFVLIIILVVGYLIYYFTNLIVETTASFLIGKVLLISLILGCIILLIKILIYLYCGLKKVDKKIPIVFFIVINCVAQAFMAESVLLNLVKGLSGSGAGLIITTTLVIASLALAAIPSAINVGVDINISGKLWDNQHSDSYELDSKFTFFSCVKLLIASLANIILAIYANPYILAD